MNDPQGEAQTQAVREAQRIHAEGLAFSAGYKALKDASMHMLEQYAKMGLSPEQGAEFVHQGLVAVAAGFRQMAIEHMHAKPDLVDAMEKRAAALGVEVYRRQWTVLLKAGGNVAVNAGGMDKPRGSGLVGLDGKPL